jgi:cell division protein FtsQ
MNLERSAERAKGRGAAWTEERGSLRPSDEGRERLKAPGGERGETEAQPVPGSAGRPRGGAAWKALFIAVAAVAIVAAAAWALLGSSLLVVRSVAVTGSVTVPKDQVLRAAAIRPGTPLVRVDTAAVARRVEQLNQVQSAQVSKHWPDSVVITIRARTPALAVAADGGFDLVDRFGVVVSHVATRPAGMVLLDTTAAPASLRDSPAVRAAATVLGQLPQPIRRRVRAVVAPSPDAVTLDLRGGITVLWGGTDRAAAKTKELQILIPTRAKSYNLSDPGTVVTGG